MFEIDKIKKYNEFDYAWTGLSIDKVKEFLYSKNTFNPLENKLEVELENRGLREIFLLYDPDYLYYTAKFLLNVELYPLQCVAINTMWKYAFPMLIGSRGFSKTFLAAVYLMLRCILFPGTKAVVCGSAFRQSKLVYDYCKSIWQKSPILKSIFKDGEPYRQQPDIWKFHLGESLISFIPIGTGEKIRGLRANLIFADEFNSIDLEIYEVVLSQFASVSMDPIKNMQSIAKRAAMVKAGMEIKEEINTLSYFNNQSIISGTLKFGFEPLAIYWQKYRDLINNQGKNNEELFGDIGKNLDWRDFAIIRIPYEMIPEGFMDDKIIARARATMHTDFYQAEYGCVPISDTNGFFKRSLIESCTAKPSNVRKPGWFLNCDSTFSGIVRGDKNKTYIMGIDPASETNNFAIVILECWPEHTRLVYCWTTNRAKSKKQGIADADYYSFCARKIRDLMSIFPMTAIGIDSGGGGIQIEEALHDPDKIRPGEVPLWPVIDRDKPKDSDLKAGGHILHMIQFSSSEWVVTSNHGLKKDMEDRVLLFPYFDPVVLGLASEKDKQDLINKEGFSSDSLEDCMIEIEGLKDELSTIIHSSTPAGREKWDTPEIKAGRNTKDRLQKDRYSAILIANSLARTLQRSAPPPAFNCVGGAVGYIPKIEGGQMYVGRQDFNIPAGLFRGITRGGVL